MLPFGFILPNFKDRNKVHYKIDERGIQVFI